VLVLGSCVIIAVMTATCRLELMGLPDAGAYRRLAQGILRESAHLLSGLNVPNKKPHEPLLECASVLREELPSLNICVHYSLKHQRGNGDPTAMFERFCCDAEAIGIQKVLLVTGPRGPAMDSAAVLEKLRGQHSAPGRVQLGVAFNACLPTEEQRTVERQRLLRKLKTGLVEEVWLNCGCDPVLLSEGVAFIRSSVARLGLASMVIYGSGLLPSEAQLWQMNERPWNGVHFGDEYLGSLAGMWRCTSSVLETFLECGVEPIIESKVRTAEDAKKLESLLRGDDFETGFLRRPKLEPWRSGGSSSHTGGGKDKSSNGDEAQPDRHRPGWRRDKGKGKGRFVRTAKELEDPPALPTVRPARRWGARGGHA